MLLALASSGHASFQDMPQSIKASAMGGAFVALADDPSAVFINPAGLINLQAPEISFMYGKPLAGLDGVDLSQGYSAIGLPVGKRLALGLRADMFRATGLLSEYQIGGGLSALLMPKLAIGVGAAYLYHSYDIARDPAYAGSGVFANRTSKGAVGVNLGLLGFITHQLQLGASISNLNRPDVGLESADPVAREIRLGGLYKMRFLRILGEVSQASDGQGVSQNNWRMGIEIPIYAVALRTGANNTGLTAGMGLRFGPFGLDYAFGMMSNISASNSGNQMVAISYKIGETSHPRTWMPERLERKQGTNWDGSPELIGHP